VKQALACAALAVLIAASAVAATHNHPTATVLAPGYADLQFTPPTPGTYRLPAMGEAADGEVIDSSGAPRRLYDLIGPKLTLLSFIYTSCSDVNGCPLASYVLRGVQNQLLKDPAIADEVRLLSVSFDPQHDTPAVLADYASRLVAPGFDWQFLTTAGDAQLTPILVAYDQWVQKDYAPDGRYLGSMSHILRVYLIDPQRRIRNIYSTSYLHADTVMSDIRTLLAEPVSARRAQGSAAAEQPQ